MSYEEQKARSCLGKATQHKKDGMTLLAIRELSSLGGHGVDAVYLECLDMLVELCFCADDGAYVSELDLTHATVRVKGANQNIKSETLTIVRIAMKHFNTMVAQMQEKVKSMTENPSNEEIILAALTGIPVSERARERYMEPCQRAAESIFRGFFARRGISFSRKTFHVYINTAVEFITLWHSLGMRDVVGKASKLVSDMLKGLIVNPIPQHTDGKHVITEEMTTNRKDFFGSESCGGATVKALCQLLTFIAEQGNWTPSGWAVVTSLKSIADALLTAKGLTDLWSEAYAKISTVFWDCNIITYHAHCLTLLAKQNASDPVFSTRAIIASLICPEINEYHNPFANYDAHSVHEDIAELFGEPSISRSKMLTFLKVNGIAAIAGPLAGSLVEAFEGTSAAPSTDFGALHSAVTALIEKDGSLQLYESLLRQAILRRQMELLATSTTRVDVQGLAMSSAGVSEQQYLRDIEPAFLQDSSLPIEIDAKSRTVMFRNAIRDKILTSFVQVAGELDVRPAVDPSQVATTATGAVVSSSSNAAITSIAVSDLIAARNHSQLMHRLQSSCVQSSSSREKDRKRKIAEVKDLRIVERQSQESKRRSEAETAKYEKDLAQFRERQRQERCKLVLTKLRAKYPRFAVDNAIARKNATVFEDELTHALATFKRMESVADKRETLRGNLFERALRQLEIPRRKEMEKMNAEQHKAERAAARQNYLLQHRKEFEKRQEERIVLQKFLEDAESHEDKWFRATGVEKVSKRDEQEMLLEQEKRRLAGEL